MPNIKEIALKAGLANFDNYQDDGKTLMVAEFDVTDQVIRTVESAVAELAKGNEPVADVVWFDPELEIFPEKKPHKIIDGSLEFMESAKLGTKLYAIPPTASQIEQETAEACAAYFGQQPHVEHFGDNIAEAIRSGAWREYKKS